MDLNSLNIKTSIYNKIGLQLSNVVTSIESEEYQGYTFTLNGCNIISRKAKITPKKAGQFVTFWKRNENKIIEPFNESDLIDFYVVNVEFENKSGQFVFPKSELISKGIISTLKKEGKRAFRVYPKWDTTISKQAIKTQKWQLKYFFEINNLTDQDEVKTLYKPK